MSNPEVNEFASKKVASKFDFSKLQKIGFGWEIGSGSGWGIHGLHLARRIMERGTAWPWMRSTPYEISGLPATPFFGQPSKGEFAPMIWAGGNSISTMGLSPRPGDGLIYVFETPHFSVADKKMLDIFGDKIITVSEWNAEVLREIGYKDVQCVHLGTDTKLFKPAKKAHRFGEGRFVIFSGGKLELRKGQDIVLAAFKIFQQRHPEALLVTMWENHWHASVLSMVESPHTDMKGVRLTDGGYNSVVRWARHNGLDGEHHEELGFVSQEVLASILSSVDVALFPNRCEGGTNMVAMECLAAGVPTILSANSGHSDLIRFPIPHFALEHNNPCMLPSSNEFWREADVEEIVEGLEHIMNKAGEARLCASLAAECMQDKFDWSMRMDAQISALRIGQDEQSLQRAIAATRKTIETLPAVASTEMASLSHMATLLIDKQKNAAALAAVRRALNQAPEDVRLVGNYSKVLLQLHQPELALEMAEKALATTDDEARKLILTNHMGLAYMYLGQMTHALECFDRIAARHNDSKYTASIIDLMNGGWVRGLKEFEFRRKHFPAEHPERGMPAWDGKSKVGTLWVTAEQGLGDMFMTARFLPWAKSKCDKLIFSVHPQLMPIFYGYPGVDMLQSYDANVPEPEADAHVPIQSLMLFSGLTPSTVPNDPGHFKKTASKIDARMRAPDGTVLKVGLVWAGSNLHQRDYERSMRLEQLLPLTENCKVQFYSLQLGEHAQDLEETGAKYLIADLSEKLQTWHATMAALLQLDMLVTVDTSIAHMAGCLGVPTLLMLCKVADWRWLRKEETNVWYPSVKLIRQKKLGDWSSVVEQVRREIKVACTRAET